VDVVTIRYTAGVDWELREAVLLYFRYNFFDFEDKSDDLNSGTANFFLAGISAIY